MKKAAANKWPALNLTCRVYCELEGCNFYGLPDRYRRIVWLLNPDPQGGYRLIEGAAETGIGRELEYELHRIWNK